MVRDRLWPVFARRATAAACRSHALVRAEAPPLVDAHAPLPQPRLEEQVAVSLAYRLPRWLVAALRVRGVRALARALAMPAKIFGRMMGIDLAGDRK